MKIAIDKTRKINVDRVKYPPAYFKAWHRRRMTPAEFKAYLFVGTRFGKDIFVNRINGMYLD